MGFNKGDKVKHPKQDAWGVGVVLETQHDDKVRIFFENVGEKTLSTNFFMPIKVTEDDVKNTVFDNLEVNSNLMGLTVLLKNFLLKYPKGFQDPEYIKEEIKEHKGLVDFVNEQLDQAYFTKLIESGAYVEIIDVISLIVNRDEFNFIDEQEKLTLLEALNDKSYKEYFADALYDVLYGQNQDFDEDFTLFAEVLGNLQSRKWTVLSSLLFIFRPEKFIYVKPYIMQNIAKTCEFNLHFEVLVNSVTYQQIMKFSNYLLESLKELGTKPKNLMDIQAFIGVEGRH